MQGKLAFGFRIFVIARNTETEGILLTETPKKPGL